MKYDKYNKYFEYIWKILGESSKHWKYIIFLGRKIRNKGLGASNVNSLQFFILAKNIFLTASTALKKFTAIVYQCYKSQKGSERYEFIDNNKLVFNKILRLKC